MTTLKQSQSKPGKGLLSGPPITRLHFACPREFKEKGVANTSDPGSVAGAARVEN